MSKLRFRDRVPGDGVFLSVPDAFAGAPESLVHSLKLSFVPRAEARSSSTADGESRIETCVHAGRALLDFGAVDTADIDLERVVRDCEIVSTAVREHPDVVRRTLDAVCGSGQDADTIGAAAAELRGIGLTEQGMLEQGGGVLPLILIAAACLLVAGCEHCQKPIAPEPEYPH